MKRTHIAPLTSLFLAGLVGCEGDVLVNNRPAPSPDLNTDQTQSQPAAYRESSSATVNENAPTTQPSRQTVETKHTRIQSD